MPETTPPEYPVEATIMSSKANTIINVDTIAELVNFINSKPFMFCLENNKLYYWDVNTPKIYGDSSPFYNINDIPLNPNAFNDEFEGATLNSAWTKKNNNSENSQLDVTLKDSLIAIAENIPLAGGFSLNPESYIYKPISGNFNLITKMLTVSPIATAGGGLALMQTDVTQAAVWFEIFSYGNGASATKELEVALKTNELEYYTGKSQRNTTTSYVSSSRQQDVNSPSSTLFYFLRVERIGTTLNFYTSLSGIWKLLYSITEDTLGFTINNIGIFAEGTSQNKTYLYCDWIRNIV